MSEKDIIRGILMKTGASAVGFATAREISSEAAAVYHEWLVARRHAGMDYLERHESLRLHPSSVLEGVRTVISLAFPYSRQKGPVASYALGLDYHKVLRKKLKPALREIEVLTGAKGRICIDSAPLDERFWAMEAGIGFRGDNGALIVPGVGSDVFLAEILLGADLTPDRPAHGKECLHCGNCRKACPNGALLPDGTIDCNRCISYLTIEHRGPFSGEMRRLTHGEIFGCDRCIRACPYNRGEGRTCAEEFRSLEATASLTAEKAAVISDGEFSELFSGTSLQRVGAEGLRRNASRSDK